MKKMWKRVLAAALTVSLISSFNMPKITFADKRSTDGIAIDVSNFPDSVFLDYVKSNFDTDGNGRLSDEEISKVTYVYVNMKGIKTLKGIENFTNLKSLYAEVNYIEELDLSQNKNLVVVYCNNNIINSIKLPNQEVNNTLEILNVFDNRLENINLENLKALKYLNLGYNKFKELDLSNNPLGDGPGFAASDNYLEKITLPNNGTEYEWLDFLAPQLYPKDKSEGYKVNWYFDEEKTQLIDQNTVKTIKCVGQTLYAEYAPITYTVQFNSNNGMAENKTQKFEYGTAQKLLKNEFTKKDYYFAGWKDEKGRIYNDESEVINLTDVDGKVLKLTAVWKEVDYTGQQYTINLHDGESVVTVTGKYGESAILPKNESTKEGYDFMGWNFGTGDYGIFSDGGKVLMTHPDDLNGDNNTLNLYSVWKKKEFTVNFIDAQNSYKKIVQYNDSVVFPVDPIKEGYTFEGWVTESGEKWDEQRGVISNLDLYAKYSPIKYSVSFDGNGADNEDAMNNIKIEMDYSKQAVLPTNMYEKASYTLEGWSTTQNGRVQFDDEDVIYQLTTENDKNVTLYAVWEKIKSDSTVTITTDSLDKVYDGKAIQVPTVENTGSTNKVEFTWYQFINDEWIKLSSAPINTGKYKVVASVLADEDYKSASSEKEFEISKAIPRYENIDNLKASYGNTLKDVKLPEGFSWQDDLSTIVGNVGENKFKVKYTPKDTSNYEVVENIEVTIKVEKAKNTWTIEPSIEGWKTGEKPNNPVGESKYGNVEFTYSNLQNGTFTKEIPTNIGTWYMKATVIGNENYSELEKIISFVIEEVKSDNVGNEDVKPSEDKFVTEVPTIKPNDKNDIIVNTEEEIKNIEVIIKDIEAIKNGTGSLNISINNNVQMNLPLSLIDKNLLEEAKDVSVKIDVVEDSDIIKGLKAINKVFDFNLIINNENKSTNIHKFADGLAEITLVLDNEDFEGLNKNKLKVYYYNEETKKFEAMETKVEGNNITFKTSHFSKYVISEEILDNNEEVIIKPDVDDEKVDNGEILIESEEIYLPETGAVVSSRIIIALAIVIIAVGGVMFIKKRK